MFGRAINACIRVQCNRSLSRPSVAWNHATSLYRNFSDWNDWNDDEFKPKRMHLINEEIPHPNLRVTYYENGESKWELLSKSDALRFARQRNLDLVLVNEKENPPICKLENYREKVIRGQMKERENLKKSKHRVLKEFTLGAGIEPHDLETTMNKAKKLMAMGHPVRLSIVAKRQTKKSGVKKYHENPVLAVEEVTLKMLEKLEGLPVTIQAVPVNFSTDRNEDGHIPLITAKKEFIVSQKVEKKQMKAKLRKAAELLELDSDPQVKAIKRADAKAAAAAAAAAAGGAVAAGAAVGGKKKLPEPDSIEDDNDSDYDEEEDEEDERDSEFDDEEEEDEDEEEEEEEEPEPPKRSPSPRRR